MENEPMAEIHKTLKPILEFVFSDCFHWFTSQHNSKYLVFDSVPFKEVLFSAGRDQLFCTKPFFIPNLDVKPGIPLNLFASAPGVRFRFVTSSKDKIEETKRKTRFSKFDPIQGNPKPTSKHITFKKSYNSAKKKKKKRLKEREG